MKKLIIITILLVLAISNIVSAKGLQFSGAMYSDIGLYHWLEDGSDSVEYTGLSQLELNFKNKNREHAKVEGSFNLNIPYGLNAELLSANSNIDSITNSGSASNSVTDANLSISDINMFLEIRKLFLTLYFPWADLAVGRQIVNFGRGYVFSPIDVFSSIDINDVNFRRKGSDVVALKIPVGDLSGVDLFMEMPTNQKEFSAAGRAFTNRWGFDFSAIGMYRFESEEILMGADFKGDIEIGVYGEMLFHFHKSEFTYQYLEAMLGLDYSLPWDFMVQGEYYYNGNGMSGTLTLNDLIGNGSFYRHHYGYLGVNQKINELSSWGANTIYNFDYSSWMISLMYQNNILQNANLLFYVRSYIDWMKEVQGFEQVMGLPDLDYNLRLEVKF